MNPLTPFVPYPGAKVRGELFADCNPLDLDQDVLQVSLPNGITIDVGWYPCNDPNGQFKIVTYRDYFRNSVRPSEQTTNPHMVLSIIAKIAEEQWAQAGAQNNIYRPSGQPQDSASGGATGNASASSHAQMKVKKNPSLVTA